MNGTESAYPAGQLRFVSNEIGPGNLVEYAQNQTVETFIETLCEHCNKPHETNLKHITQKAEAIKHVGQPWGWCKPCHESTDNDFSMDMKLHELAKRYGMLSEAARRDPLAKEQYGVGKWDGPAFSQYIQHMIRPGDVIKTDLRKKLEDSQDFRAEMRKNLDEKRRWFEGKEWYSMRSHPSEVKTLLGTDEKIDDPAESAVHFFDQKGREIKEAADEYLKSGNYKVKSQHIEFKPLIYGNEIQFSNLQHVKVRPGDAEMRESLDEIFDKPATHPAKRPEVKVLSGPYKGEMVPEKIWADVSL